MYIRCNLHVEGELLCDVVSSRDVEVMEMLEWFKLMEEQGALYEQFHNCNFNVNKLAKWEGHI